MNRIVFYVVFLLLVTGCEPSIITVYVSSTEEIEYNKIVFNTIEEGLAEASSIRKKDKNIPVVIQIQAGENRLNTPLKITPELGNLKIVEEGSIKMRYIQIQSKVIVINKKTAAIAEIDFFE